MASEAQKEPTMEEILASIRKIISDDDPSAQPETPAARVRESDVQIQDAENDDFEDDAFDDLIEIEDETVESVLAATEPGPVSQPEPEPDMSIDAFADDLMDDIDPVEEAKAIADPAPEPVAPPPVAAEPSPAKRIEEMPASPKYEQTILTEESTADAAAGALGKLISRMDLGGDNTLEGLVREMLKPMIKEWLDDNLPKIVEEKVEAEVQRIARMAR